MNDNVFLAPFLSTHSHNQNHISKYFLLLITKHDSEAWEIFHRH